MAAIRAIKSSITRPLCPPRPRPARMDATFGVAGARGGGARQASRPAAPVLVRPACSRPGVPGVPDGLVTADEALVPRVPPPEPRAGPIRLGSERPGAGGGPGAPVAPGAGDGAVPADRAGVGAGALESHGSGVGEGERDGVSADRAVDRPGLRKVRRD